ncbi:hypothetical protein GSI_12895 [Ganoderma sinense ZZ0214-1]|uniref:Uncharacterized protein n=1 Tax=Ganoderma sinense ZZ0214-1 TaxID=1077348 RepID=A0A2G8RU12_9APHY|nr:hypothetical protein GSI_12895 [Ganoderma sinense ZZ0214-1]
MPSTEYGDVVNVGDRLVDLPNGNPFVMTQHYTAGQSGGVAFLVVVSCISASALLGLLGAIAISAWNTRTSTSSSLFVRSHIAPYFLSLLLCEVAQTIGSMMSIRWVHQKGVSYESFCTVQGTFKHLSDVGTACWSLIIAMNTFWVLFLRWRPGKTVPVITFLVGWGFIIAIIVSGPTGIQRADAGPFYAISGYWCWISDQYPAERITMDYMVMFLSAFLSFVMYSLVFFRLRGDILGQGWRLKVRLRRRDLDGIVHGSIDTHVVNIAKGMLLYPVAYTILLLPIAVCRFADWSGHQVPFGATIFSDSIFLLSGFVNVILFLTMRRVLPMNTVLPRQLNTLFPSLRSESFAATGSYTLASYATTTQTEKPVVHNGNLSDGAPRWYPRPLPRPPVRAQSTSAPSSSAESTSETLDLVPRRSSDREEADITSALHGAEHGLSRVPSDPASLMIFIPANALKER